MTTLETRTRTAAPSRSVVSRGGSAPLLLVVGYDDTPASRTALAAAADMIHGRSGHLAVVFVAHVPGTVALSPEATLGVRLSLEEEAGRMGAEVRAALDDREPRWHFERRIGVVTEQLFAAAANLRRIHAPGTNVGIVVGGSLHRYHHVLGSVPVSLARAAKYPVMVVPSVR